MRPPRNSRIHPGANMAPGRIRCQRSCGSLCPDCDSADVERESENSVTGWHWLCRSCGWTWCVDSEEQEPAGDYLSTAAAPKLAQEAPGLPRRASTLPRALRSFCNGFPPFCNAVVGRVSHSESRGVGRQAKVGHKKRAIYDNLGGQGCHGTPEGTACLPGGQTAHRSRSDPG